VHGVATRHERIYRLEGISEIEALPQFYKWVRKPVVGETLVPTLDSLSMPFSLVLKAPTQDELTEAAAQVRRILRWNRSVGLGRRLAVGARSQSQHYAAAVRVRVLSSLAPKHGMIAPVTRADLFSTLIQRMRSLFTNALDTLWRRVQLLEIGRRRAVVHAAPRTPEEQVQADAVIRWAREYLSRPHPKLGRPGPICPFVRNTIELGRFVLSSYDDADGTHIRRLRRVVLDEARGFLASYPREASNSTFASLVLVFPQLPDAKLDLLDRVHDELKTHLITRHDLMFSPFHKRSAKPSISNPDFAVFRAPFPILALRYMDVRDIVFIDQSPQAFRHYRARFGSLYERGEVSDEFGYVRRYTQACARFGVPAPDSAAAQTAHGEDRAPAES
jgi:heptaprenyl diphosphate synthase